ncbi:conserved hypothetical protein [Ricinus communis]|uniref:Uncharacterized protein n=1 Tax=Ricinus communis TaxID=3988 RepID=B9T9L6_RICCO|nr:conserved hypothetical protein [Ricinus communis]
MDRPTTAARHEAMSMTASKEQQSLIVNTEIHGYSSNRRADQKLPPKRTSSRLTQPIILSVTIDWFDLFSVSCTEVVGLTVQVGLYRRPAISPSVLSPKHIHTAANWDDASCRGARAKGTSGSIARTDTAWLPPSIFALSSNGRPNYGRTRPAATICTSAASKAVVRGVTDAHFGDRAFVGSISPGALPDVMKPQFRVANGAALAYYPITQKTSRQLTLIANFTDLLVFRACVAGLRRDPGSNMKNSIAAVAALFGLYAPIAHAEYTWQTWNEYRDHYTSGGPKIKMQGDLLDLYIAGIASSFNSANALLELHHEKKLYCLKEKNKQLAGWELEQLLDYARASADTAFIAFDDCCVTKANRVVRRHVSTLMKRTCIEALYRNTSREHTAQGIWTGTVSIVDLKLRACNWAGAPSVTSSRDRPLFDGGPTKPLGALASGHLHGLQRPRNAKYVHDPLQVVGQHLKTHLRTHSPERPGQEVCRTHPVLQRTEDMLDGTSADGHCVGFPVKPALHGFQCALVFPASDAAIVAG